MSRTVHQHAGGFPSGPVTGEVPTGGSLPGTALLIGRDWRPSSTGAAFPTRNPGDGQGLAHVATAADRDVDDAVLAARTAMADPTWTELPKPTLARMLSRVAE